MHTAILNLTVITGALGNGGLTARHVLEIVVPIDNHKGTLPFATITGTGRGV